MELPDGQLGTTLVEAPLGLFPWGIRGALVISETVKNSIICQEDVNVNADNSNAGNLPLLSVLGINQNSDAIVEEESSQHFSSTDNSTGSISNKSVSQTSNTNNNISISNAVTVRSCRSENSGSNVDPSATEATLPNLQSLAISPRTP